MVQWVGGHPRHLLSSDRDRGGGSRNWCAGQAGYRGRSRARDRCVGTVAGMTEHSAWPTAAAVRTAAALGTCAVRNDHGDMAVVLDDATDLTNPHRVDPVAVVAATSYLIGESLAAIAVVDGYNPPDFAAGIAGRYRDLLGPHAREVLICYAAAMGVGGRIDLEAAMIAQLVMAHGPYPSAITAALLLGTVWGQRANAEGRSAVEIGQQVTLATA
jgi:hypothetical protein